MTSSALFLGVLGLTVSFFPQEILAHFNEEAEPFSLLFTKFSGLFLMSFAILNWMARGNIIGGIYSRPVALGNVMQFFFGASLLIELLMTEASGNLGLWGITIGYSLFGLAFLIIMFGNPIPKKGAT